MKLKTAMKKGAKTSKLNSSSRVTGSMDKPKIKSSRSRVSADSLKWKSVRTQPFAGMDEGGGMMMFEELDGVGVEWEEDINGSKTAKFVVSPSYQADHLLAEELSRSKWPSRSAMM